MLVSRSKQFIFIHVPKTAGSTLTRKLAPYCSPWATQDSSRGRAVRWFGEKLAARVLIFDKHLSISKARTLLPPSKFNEYFKFGLMRNPFDLLVSSYFYQLKDENNINNAKVRAMSGFEEFVLTMPHRSDFQKSYLWDNGACPMDYIGDFNTLDKTVDQINDRLKIFIDLQSRVNASDHGHYSTYYTPELRSRVSKLYEEDIAFYNELFGKEAQDF